MAVPGNEGFRYLDIYCRVCLKKKPRHEKARIGNLTSSQTQIKQGVQLRMVLVINIFENFMFCLLLGIGGS